MEQNKLDVQLVPNMIMCGDHPSVTKAELNAKENKPEQKERDLKKFLSYGRITPMACKSDHGQEGSRSRAASEHALRRAARRPDRADVQGRALVQAALGSFRWPPYLLCAWLLVLLATHALHCLVAVLERALPALRKTCQYFRAWTEASWRAESELGQRVCPAALACATGALYTVYGGLYVLYSVAVWAVEPLCSDLDDVAAPDMPKIVDYADDVTSKMDLNLKQ